MQKPDPRLFEIGLEELCIVAAEALMVGDRACRDAGGSHGTLVAQHGPPNARFLLHAALDESSVASDPT